MNPEYDICTSESLNDLIAQVTKMLSDKWQLVGGICILYCGESTTFYQAMFRVSHIKTISQLMDKVK